MNIKPSKLKLTRVAEVGNDMNISYEISFQNLDEKTTVSEQLSMSVGGQSTAVAIHITGCSAPTPDAALDKLADWFEAYAKTIRERGEAVFKLPFY